MYICPSILLYWQLLLSIEQTTSESVNRRYRTQDSFILGYETMISLEHGKSIAAVILVINYNRQQRQRRESTELPAPV